MKQSHETKKGAGRPRADTEALTLRLSTDVIRAIDDARRVQDDLPGRPEAIRRILLEWLKAHGHLRSEQREDAHDRSYTR